MAVIYRGDGSEFINGVPARDLTDEEFAALTEEQQETVQASPLYEHRNDAKGTAPAQNAPAA